MKLLRLIGFLLVLIGFVIPINYATEVKNEEAIEKLAIEEIKHQDDKYFAILEIPKIELKKILFPINDSNNNVDKNLLIVKESVFPENERSNVIIAGHSGNGKNAYFKNLYKINIGEELVLYYNDYIYTYEVKEIEFQDKTGTLYLSQDYQKMLTLITCTRNDSKHQTIYYAELKSQEKMSKIS